MKKITFLSLFVMINVLISCIGDELDCPPNKSYFKINSLIAQNFKQLDVVNGYSYDLVNTLDTVEQEKYFIGLHTVTDYYAQNLSLNTGGTLLALSCDENYGNLGSKEGVKNIIIITLQDFNQNYKANDTITNSVKFELRENQNVDFNNFLTKEEFIEQNKTSLSKESINIKITESIDEEFVNTSFKIILELTNGDAFEITTDEIIIKE